jgi:hypothetical protein
MSGPGIIRPDLCSIHAATEQAELADAVRRLLSAYDYPLADDAPLGGAWIVTCRHAQRTEAGR